ncbi:single-stranded DNA-binding protein [Nocardioides sp. MAH-18]|uniref:Single-stranded DNA-binding protein n=1 Tax=Nocardioides agri TaxID=2682843 RepID=A0A6L6XVA9_9ACTN|nr:MULTISPECIES: single-stranded DNA-binding protein [unclassified Nocardioides]MBA2956286.1 single-stranded DNA-binding protein [Nocardioides sp. CGMCC 1.13656]MVQ51129.1 single-stranded DNA-binding protein [Nocardioides sp. MAH-18]
MTDSTITVRGWLGADVQLRAAAGVPVASFRLACTPRRFNRRTETWSDGLTQWYTVSAWRGLADNCAASLRRGDPVVVHGRLEARTYVNANGVEVLSLEIDALHVGHDLSRGTTVFTRAPRSEPDTAASEAATPEAAA